MNLVRMSPKFRIGNRTYNLPRSRLVRSIIGLCLIIGGFLGFLPVLGFWMIPMGFLVLSIDWAIARRLRRQLTLWWGRRGNNGRQS